MSLSSVVSLGALRLQAQDRADLENNQIISTQMWNQYISQSYKELYDLLVGAYGNDYFVASPYSLTMTANQFYALPSDFYKLLGVDIQNSASPTGWASLKRFEFLSRNQYSYLQSNLNTTAQTSRVWYIPEPTSLQFLPTCATTLSSAVVTMTDASVITAGMSVAGVGIPAYAYVTAVNVTVSPNQVTLSAVCVVTQPIVCLQFWTDASQVDGIAGWEEYVIIDAAIKANIKQEGNVGELRVQKQAMLDRINAMAEGRDAGQAHHSTDALAINSWGYNSIGGTSLRYRLVGSQLMLVPCAADDNGSDGYFGGGAY